MHPDTDSAGDAHIQWLDRYYGAQRHIYDLTRRLFLPGRDWLLRRICREHPASVLELGCGTARNLARLATRLDRAYLCGVDASGEMLRSARRHTGLHLFQSRAEAVTGPDVLGRPGGFEAVFFSYSLSMIPDWRGALEAARRCLAPKGLLHVVDFWDFGGWPGVLRRALNRRLLSHHIRHEPGVLEWLRAAGAEIAPLARRWAYIARVPARH